MSIKDFFSSMLPSFERDRISEDVAGLRKELHEHVVPAYTRAAKVVQGKGFKNEEVKAFDLAFNRAIPELGRHGFFEASRRLFLSVEDQLAVIDKMIDGMFAKDVTKETLTYQKATVLRYLEAARFATRYSARVLLWATEVETNAVLDKAAASDLTPAELNWLKDNQRLYLDVLPILNQTAQELKQTIASIPDITIMPERMDVVRQTVGAHKLDPMQLGFLGASKLNLIYHLRMYYAEWQVKRYKAMVEEKRTLEFRLLALQEAYSGKQDAKLAQAIEYSQGRLQRLNFELARLEERYLED